MQRSTHAIFGVLLAVAHCGYGFAEESPSWWWPFSRGDAETQATTPPATTPVPSTAEPAATDAPWPALPKFQWPDFSAPHRTHSVPRAQRARAATRGKPATMRRRNAWAQSQPNIQNGETELRSPSSPWQTVTDGAHRLGESTRTAWHKTVDVLVPSGDPADAAATQREPRVSWWRRMWGAEEPKPEGPRTVTEWMAQERLDP